MADDGVRLVKERLKNLPLLALSAGLFSSLRVRAALSPCESRGRSSA